jgi:hypothetical protein
VSISYEVRPSETSGIGHRWVWGNGGMVTTRENPKKLEEKPAMVPLCRHESHMKSHRIEPEIS